MKKIHIVFLILIMVAITTLISFTGDLSTYETIASAKKKDGKFVNLIVKLDKTVPLEYDPVNNPNLLTFAVTDTLGDKVHVVYHNTKPTDMEKSERIVLKGKMVGNRFECKDILLKCPSKYKDNVNSSLDALNESSSGYISADTLKKRPF